MWYSLVGTYEYFSLNFFCIFLISYVCKKCNIRFCHLTLTNNIKYKALFYYPISFILYSAYEFILSKFATFCPICILCVGTQHMRFVLLWERNNKNKSFSRMGMEPTTVLQSAYIGPAKSNIPFSFIVPIVSISLLWSKPYHASSSHQLKHTSV